MFCFSVVRSPCKLSLQRADDVERRHARIDYVTMRRGAGPARLGLPELLRPFFVRPQPRRPASERTGAVSARMIRTGRVRIVWDMSGYSYPDTRLQPGAWMRHVAAARAGRAACGLDRVAGRAGTAVPYPADIFSVKTTEPDTPGLISPPRTAARGCTCSSGQTSARNSGTVHQARDRG